MLNNAMNATSIAKSVILVWLGMLGFSLWKNVWWFDLVLGAFTVLLGVMALVLVPKGAQSRRPYKVMGTIFIVGGTLVTLITLYRRFS